MAAIIRRVLYITTEHKVDISFTPTQTEERATREHAQALNDRLELINEGSSDNVFAVGRTETTHGDFTILKVTRVDCGYERAGTR